MTFRHAARTAALAVSSFAIVLPASASASAAPPAAATLGSPTYSAYLNSQTPPLTWKPSATPLPVQYEVDIDGHQAGAVDGVDCATTCSFTPPVLAEGEHTWKVVARNGDGSAETETRTFTVDVTLKILSFHVAEPWSFLGLGPAVSVIHGPQCPRAGVTTDHPGDIAQFTLDGEPYNGSRGLTASLACSIPAGPHTMVATVTDDAGNTATSSLVFQTDLVRPQVKIEGPAHVVKGTTATFKAVADSSTLVGAATFDWNQGPEMVPSVTCPMPSEGDELRVPITLDSTEISIATCDAEGDGSVTTLQVVAGPQPPSGAAGVKVGQGGYSSQARTKLRLVWPAGATRVTITDPANGRTQTLPVAASIPWTLAGSGRSTVHVQYDWPLPAKTYTASVVVDTARPKLTTAVARGATLSLHARDTGSGVTKLQLAKQRSHPSKARPYRSKVRSGAAIWARVIDKAGNRSAWRRIAHRG